MYRDDKRIPVKRIKYDSSSGQYIDAPLSVPFLKGPIPMDWLSAAGKLPGKAFHLGIAIWWLANMANTKKVKLTARALDYVGISRDASSDALKRMEVRGLIRVQRLPGQRPIVEILSVAQGVTKRENTE